VAANRLVPLSSHDFWPHEGHRSKPGRGRKIRAAGRTRGCTWAGGSGRS